MRATYGGGASCRRCLAASDWPFARPSRPIGATTLLGSHKSLVLQTALVSSDGLLSTYTTRTAWLPVCIMTSKRLCVVATGRPCCAGTRSERHRDGHLGRQLGLSLKGDGDGELSRRLDELHVERLRTGGAG